MCDLQSVLKICCKQCQGINISTTKKIDNLLTAVFHKIRMEYFSSHNVIIMPSPRNIFTHGPQRWNHVPSDGLFSLFLLHCLHTSKFWVQRWLMDSGGWVVLGWVGLGGGGHIEAILGVKRTSFWTDWKKRF